MLYFNRAKIAIIIICDLYSYFVDNKKYSPDTHGRIQQFLQSKLLLIPQDSAPEKFVAKFFSPGHD